MAGWVVGNDVNKIPDLLWRPLVADRGMDGKSVPPWYRRACMYCLHKASPDGDLNTSKLIANKSAPETVVHFLKRVQAVIWNRKFPLCAPSSGQSQSLFGFGSRYIQEGDLVCILYSCSVPVVLRNTFHNSPSYLLQGECYIHGMMDGEALAGLTEEMIAASTVEYTIFDYSNG